MPRPRFYCRSLVTAALFASAAFAADPGLALPEITLPGPATGGDLAPSARDRFTDLFRPAQTESATLSPDGRHLAYAVREGDQLAVLIVATAQPAVALAKVAVVNDALATPRFGRSEEHTSELQ